MLLEVIAILALAGLGLVGGRLIGLSPIPSYLLAGVLAGPGGLGWLAHTRSLDQLAEVGVALLLFGVGIEFSLDRLRRGLGRMALSGALQVGLTIVLAAIALRAGGASFATAVFAGFLVSLSSTAIVFKLYADEDQIDAPASRAAAGILLFQDLALVPMMLLVPVLAAPGEHVASRIAQALGGALVALGAILFAARTALPRGIAALAGLRVRELFPLIAFLVALGMALLASRVGLSLPMPHAIAAPVVERDHVLVIGHGTTGQAVSRVLGNTGVRFVAVDFDVDVVAAGRREGLPLHFGDASRLAILEQLGAARARAAVVALGDPGATRRAVAMLHELNPHLRILARTARVSEVAELEALGASEVVPSELEASIELFVRLLLQLGVPPHVVRVEESLLRIDHYEAMRAYGASPGLLDGVGQLIAAGILETAQVLPGSPACDRTIGELEVRQRTGATILAVVHDDVALPQITPATRLHAGDRVVLHGPHEAIDRVLGLFEPPPKVRDT
jgi:voltage-gated potassium channel Kch